MSEKFEVKLIGIENVEQMTNVHLSAFSNNLLSQLGFNVVKRYYEWQFTDIDKYNKKIYALGVFELENMVAFSVFGMARNAKIGFLKKNWSFLMMMVIIKFYKIKFNHIIEVVKNFKYFVVKVLVSSNDKVLRIDNNEDNIYGILVTACKQEYEGRGFGSILMRRAEKVARENKAVGIKLSVRETNEHAWKIYEALGYIKVVDDLGNWVGNSMIKKL